MCKRLVDTLTFSIIFSEGFSPIIYLFQGLVRLGNTVLRKHLRVAMFPRMFTSLSTLGSIVAETVFLALLSP